MNKEIKEALADLFMTCLDKGVSFTYSDHVNAISIHKVLADNSPDWIEMHFCLDVDDVDDVLKHLNKIKELKKAVLDYV